MPSFSSVARLRRVAVWVHILGFIAGAISTGLSVASSTVEARSLASPLASFRHQVGGGRRDDDQVGLARQADMADIVLVLAVEQVGEDMVGRQRADRQRRDEFLRGGRHDTAHGGAALAQAADQVERLVGRDAAADDQQDALARQCARCVARGAWGRSDRLRCGCADPAAGNRPKRRRGSSAAAALPSRRRFARRAGAEGL